MFSNPNFSAYDFPLPGADRQPKTIPLNVDFSSGATQIIDFSLAVAAKRIEFVRSIFIDNSSNGNTLTITMALTGQQLVIPAFAQAYLPILLSQNSVLTFFTASVNAVISIQLINISLPPIIWDATSFTFVVAGGTSGSARDGARPAQAAHLLSAIAAKGDRSIVEIQNQSADQLQLWLYDASALPNVVSVILLESGGANAAGGSWQSQTFKGAVNIYGPNAGAQFAAYIA